MITETEGNLFVGIRPWSVLLHQVNCLGVAGAGVALGMRREFPGWYSDYRLWCEQEPDKKRLLGTTHSYSPRRDLVICSAFAQLNISKSRRVTDYEAWDKILRRLESRVSSMNEKHSMNWEIRAPWGIGCGLGGGDWRVMRDLFEFYFGDSKARLVFVRAPEP